MLFLTLADTAHGCGCPGDVQKIHALLYPAKVGYQSFGAGITGRLGNVAARILAIDAGLREAAARIRAGQLVAFPTETVYGLGADALNPDAVRSIFTAKGRPSTNPVIVHVADVESARALSSDWTPIAERLAQRFWPGPLTLVVKAAPEIPSVVMASGTTVGIRIPAHAGARSLISACGCPIAAPSANRSEAVSPTEAAHVVLGLGLWVDDLLVLDGGACEIGIESTVVDVTGKVAVVLRPGDVTEDEIANLVSTGSDSPRLDGPVRSPGQMLRHYAPRCPVHIMPADVQVSSAVCLDTDEWLLWIGASAICSERTIYLGSDAKSVAKRLYAGLHLADAAGATRINVGGLPNSAAWAAVADRLARAVAVAPDVNR